MHPVKDNTAQTAQKDNTSYFLSLDQALWLVELRSHCPSCSSRQVWHSHVQGSTDPQLFNNTASLPWRLLNTGDLVGNYVIVHRNEQNLYHSAACALLNIMPQKHLWFSLEKQAKNISVS